jgi:fimbrial chaperone protein
MRKSLRICLVALTLLMTSAAYVFAFTFQPMFVRLDASGPGSIQTFQVSNESDTSLAVRFSVLTRAAGPDGKESNEDASGLFTIYPERVVVEPHSSAAMKLQWNGPPGLASERPFRLVAENVAVDSSAASTSGLRVMFRYVASVYVGKPTFAPHLVWIVKGARGTKGEKGFNVEILNSGTKHVIVDAALLTITGVKGKAVTLGNKDLGVLSGANYLPGSPQRLFIVQADAVPGSIYKAQLSYDPEF